MGQVPNKSYSSKNCLEGEENISWAICWRIFQMRIKAATSVFCFYYYPVLSPAVYQNEYLYKGLRYPGVAESVSRADLLRLGQRQRGSSSQLCKNKGNEDSVSSPGLLIPAQTLDVCLPSLQMGKKAPWECCSVLLPSHVIPGQVCLESVPSDNNNHVLSSIIKAIMI